MQVKEAVLLAATQLGIVDKIQECLDYDTTEGKEELDLLITCFNVVENELALDYLPLYQEEELQSLTGKINYAMLKRTAVRILQVTDADDNSLKFTIFPDCFKTQAGKIKVSYNYMPQEKSVVEKSDYETLSPRLFAYGMAAEYATVKGLYEEANVWDKKYKEAVQAAYKLRPFVQMRSRRWV